jgi:hypothetical protein
LGAQALRSQCVFTLGDPQELDFAALVEALREAGARSPLVR